MGCRKSLNHILKLAKFLPFFSWIKGINFRGSAAFAFLSLSKSFTMPYFNNATKKPARAHHTGHAPQIEDQPVSTFSEAGFKFRFVDIIWHGEDFLARHHYIKVFIWSVAAKTTSSKVTYQKLLLRFLRKNTPGRWKSHYSIETYVLILNLSQQI